MNGHLRTSSALVLVLATLALAGCQTTGATPEKQANNSRIAGAMATAANDAATSGRLAESLAINEKLYHDDPNNTDRILSYARDLRRAGRIDDAKLVIRTPALSKKATEPMLTECALTLVAEGSYQDAVGFAEKAIAKNPKSPDAHQALALAKSGTGDHASAENAFAEALALWPEGRNQTAVINNLAMSQAAQGHIAQANATMAMATGEALRSEVYQNNRAFLSSMRDMPATVAPKVSSIDVVDVTPVANIDSEDSDAAMVITPSKKPSDKVAFMPRSPEVPPQAQAVPVQAVEKNEIENLKKAQAQPVATPQETTISPAAGGTVRPTPLFEPADAKPKKTSNNWWNMGFSPNEDSHSRRGLNK